MTDEQFEKHMEKRRKDSFYNLPLSVDVVFNDDGRIVEVR